MPIDLADYEPKARTAVQAFWGNRAQARERQIAAGVTDQGERAGVTAGKNMEGFVDLVCYGSRFPRLTAAVCPVNAQGDGKT